MTISNPLELRREQLVTGYQFTPNASGPGQQEDTQAIDLSGFIRILKQQWKLVAAIALGVLALAFLYVFTATVKYTASSNLLINPQPTRVFGSDYVPQDGNANKMLIESQTRVISSRGVLSKVVLSQNLTSDPEFTGRSRGEALTGSPRLFEEALHNLNEKLAVKRPNETYVVEVAVSSRDGEKAARLANAVANAYIADQAESRQDTTRHTSKLLSDRLDALRARVESAESRVQTFKAKHNIVEASGGLVNERHLARLNDELLAARNRMSAAKAKADKVRAILRAGIVPGQFDEAVKSRLVARLREQYAAAARRESQLASVYGAAHPRLIAARARVKRSRALVQGELKRIAGALKADVDVEGQRIKSLEKRLRKSRGVTDLTNKARVRLAGLEREASASRAVYERVLAKAREAGASEKIALVDARIISKAVAPQWASWPKKKIILPLALFLGLGLGIAGALVNDMRRDRFVSVRELERATGLAPLAVLPAPDRSNWVSLESVKSGGATPATGAQSPYYDLYMELSRLGSNYAMAVMGLVRNIMQRRGVRTSHAIMMVSSTPHEGSSNIAWSTALTAAMQKQSVLLVDGDGGNGELAKTLSPHGAKALSDVRMGRSRLWELVVDDKDLGLSFLPLVSRTEGGADVNWRDYRAMLAQLPEIMRAYDLVVVDGGAILNAGLAHMLVDFVDDVALVVRFDDTSRQTVKDAMKALNVSSDKHAGVILSHMDGGMA